jgi:hypothetical protein
MPFSKRVGVTGVALGDPGSETAIHGYSGQRHANLIMSRFINPETCGAFTALMKFARQRHIA